MLLKAVLLTLVTSDVGRAATATSYVSVSRAKQGGYSYEVIHDYPTKGSLASVHVYDDAGDYSDRSPNASYDDVSQNLGVEHSSSLNHQLGTKPEFRKLSPTKKKRTRQYRPYSNPTTELRTGGADDRKKVNYKIPRGNIAPLTKPGVSQHNSYTEQKQREPALKGKPKYSSYGSDIVKSLPSRHPPGIEASASGPGFTFTSPSNDNPLQYGEHELDLSAGYSPDYSQYHDESEAAPEQYNQIFNSSPESAHEFEKFVPSQQVPADPSSEQSFSSFESPFAPLTGLSHSNEYDSSSKQVGLHSSELPYRHSTSTLLTSQAGPKKGKWRPVLVGSPKQKGKLYTFRLSRDFKPGKLVGGFKPSVGPPPPHKSPNLLTSVESHSSEGFDGSFDSLRDSRYFDYDSSVASLSSDERSPFEQFTSSYDSFPSDFDSGEMKSLRDYHNSIPATGYRQYKAVPVAKMRPIVVPPIRTTTVHSRTTISSSLPGVDVSLFVKSPSPLAVHATHDTTTTQHFPTSPRATSYANSNHLTTGRHQRQIKV